MCGRYTLRTSSADLAEVFQLLRQPEWEPRYNIAPTQLVLVVRQQDGLGRDAARMRWGLIPSWANDPKIGSRMINARAETLFEKPAFRTAAKQRQCLIPADGFYEWRTEGKVKQPFYIQRVDRQPFAFAGLWETWRDAKGDPVESCTIVTTEANELLKTLHDRMPVILPEDDYDRWLDPKQKDATALEPLLGPLPASELTMHAVSPLVNRPANDTPACIEPLE